MITIYPSHASKRKHDQSQFFDILKEMTGLEIVPFSCARAAMVYALRALGMGRMDEILVPPFLGQCVLSALTRAVFPTMTPSPLTKSILVFHQFGYPQEIEKIENVARRNGWVIINDCANTIFSVSRGEMVIKWGDITVLSFPKLYPCTLGGALISGRPEIENATDFNYKALSTRHKKRANMAHEILEKAQKNQLGSESEFEIESVYGYIPEIVAFPYRSLISLPNAVQEIREDVERRKEIVDILTFYFSDRIPECPKGDLVPSAVPIAGDPRQLERLSLMIKKEFGVIAPVLHFDFARNMLNSDYRKSLVIGCHEKWSKGIVTKICELIKNILN